MDWVPIVFATFKLVVLGIGMFYAIKWHYDQGKKQKGGGIDAQEARAVLRASGLVVLLFGLALLGLGLLTFDVARALGLDLTLRWGPRPRATSPWPLAGARS
jgi:hypothetical protein